MNPLVSVVVTTYNQAAYIEQTLESVCAQTYDSYEVIVVDDGSTDDTASLMARFDGRIEYIRQKNMGVAGSRNTGIGKARGEFIAFLDGDDLWESDKLSVQVAEARRNPNSGLIVCDGVQFDKRGIIKSTLFFDTGNKNISEDSVTTGNCYQRLLHGPFISTTSQVMVPKKVLETVGLSDLKLKRASDYDLYLRIAAKFEVTIIHRRLTRWRYLATSVSGPLNLRNFSYLPEDIAILNKHLTVCHRRDQSMIREIIRRKLADGANKLYYFGSVTDRKSATRILWTLLTGNLTYPVAAVSLAGLWCPSTLRNMIASTYRKMFCRGVFE